MHFAAAYDTLELDIDEIEADDACQMRPALSQAVVEHYAALLADDVRLPPPKVLRDEDGVDWLYDGWHTLEAARKNGWKVIECQVEPGTRREAILKACGANADHGLHRDAETIRRAIYTLKDDPEWRCMTQKQIAATVGCSRVTANKWCQQYDVDRGLVPRKKPKGDGNGKPAKDSSASTNPTVLRVDTDATDGDGFEATGPTESDAARIAREHAEMVRRCEGIRKQLSPACLAIFDHNLRGWEGMRSAVSLLRDQYRQQGGKDKALGPWFARVAMVVGCPEPARWLACLDCREVGDGDARISTGLVGSQKCPACRGRGFMIPSN